VSGLQQLPANPLSGISAPRVSTSLHTRRTAVGPLPRRVVRCLPPCRGSRDRHQWREFTRDYQVSRAGGRHRISLGGGNSGRCAKTLTLLFKRRMSLMKIIEQKSAQAVSLKEISSEGVQ